jgi:hypothetical protein
MLSLFGLTTICAVPLFMQRYFIRRPLLSGFAVAVNPRTGVPSFIIDLSSETFPNASRKAACPFFPIPLIKK